MATPIGRPDAPLEGELFDDPHHFRFFQAVRLLERLRPGSAPVGGAGPPRREAVRFLAKDGLAFPASEVHALEPPPADRPDGPPRMTVSFLGLTGPLGVLPFCYTELVAARLRAGDGALKAFLDLFHHRLTSLFYRAWEKAHLAISIERGGGGRAAQVLFGLIGLGTDGLRGRHRFADEAFLPFAGFLSRRHRPASVLERLLRDHFGLQVSVISFVGRWLSLAREDRSTLGPRDPKSALGVGLIVGARVWDEQGSFRVRIGPLSIDRFRDLGPDGREFRAIAEMTRFFVDGEFDFDIQLVLLAEDVPGCRLGSGSRLGRDAWLKSRPFPTDADDAIFPGGA